MYIPDKLDGRHYIGTMLFLVLIIVATVIIVSRTKPITCWIQEVDAEQKFQFPNNPDVDEVVLCAMSNGTVSSQPIYNFISGYDFKRHKVKVTAVSAAQDE